MGALMQLGLWLGIGFIGLSILFAILSGNTERVLSEGFAAGLSLMILYMLCISISGLTGGHLLYADCIPFFDSNLIEYGSVTKMLKSDFLVFATEFFELMILNFFMAVLDDIIYKYTADSREPIPFSRKMIIFAVKLGVAIFLTYIVKSYIDSSAVFKWISTILSSLAAILATVYVPVRIIALLKTDVATRLAQIAIISLLIKQSRYGKALSHAFFNTVVFVLAVTFIESQYPDYGAFANTLSTVLQAFLPVLIVLIGLALMVSSMFVKRKKRY